MKYDAKEEDIKQMAHTACHGDGRGGYVGGFVKSDEADVANIYQLMLG